MNTITRMGDFLCSHIKKMYNVKGSRCEAQPLFLFSKRILVYMVFSFSTWEKIRAWLSLYVMQLFKVFHVISSDIKTLVIVLAILL